MKRLEENYQLIRNELVQSLLEPFDYDSEHYEKEAGTIPQSYGKWRVFYIYKQVLYGSPIQLSERLTIV